MATEHYEGELVLLRVCGDSIEASSIRSLLAANDIRCVIQGEQHRSMLGMLGSYIEPRVLVSPTDLQRAQELLAEVESGAAEIDADAALGDEAARLGEDVAVEGAPRCELHHRKSTRTCIRCGTFLCDLCRVVDAERPVCEDCEDRLDQMPARRARRRRVIGFVLLAIFAGPVVVLFAAELLDRLLR